MGDKRVKDKKRKRNVIALHFFTQVLFIFRWVGKDMKKNIKNSLIVGFQKTQVKCFGPWSLHKCPQDLGWGRRGNSVHKWAGCLDWFVNANLRGQILNHAGVGSWLALCYWFGQWWICWREPSRFDWLCLFFPFVLSASSLNERHLLILSSCHGAMISSGTVRCY